MRAQRAAGFVIAAIAAIQLVIIGGFIFGIGYLVYSIHEHGAKAVIERFWQGPSSDTSK